MPIPASLQKGLTLPVICAPMFIVSNIRLVSNFGTCVVIALTMLTIKLICTFNLTCLHLHVINFNHEISCLFITAGFPKGLFCPA